MFLYLFTVFTGFFFLAYVIKLFRIRFYALAERSLALVNTLLLAIDEDEKVRLVHRMNNQLLLSLAMVVLAVCVAVGVGSVPFVFYLFFENLGLNDLDFSSIPSIIALSIGSTMGFVVPVKNQGSESYSELSQLLHRMALNNYAIAYKLFRKEAGILSRKGISEKDKFLIVSGLARSGTTSLMNKLTMSDGFVSLSYANMPFLTSPNLWRKIYKPKKGKKRERSHKDGIMIGQDSIEALEEYFFKVISNDSFIEEETLVKHCITEKQYADYVKYQGVVRNNDQKIYLAKNNNFLLRYESLREFNKAFVVVFMFRDPLTHAASLLAKHKEFTAMQKEDGFVLEYMNWLGHHEFGLNQKVFQFSEIKPNFSESKNTLDYWLQVWINYYHYLLSIERTGIILVDYDDYCQKPNETIDRIFKRIGITAELPQFNSYHNTREVEYDCSEELKKQAFGIHRQLKELA